MADSLLSGSVFLKLLSILKILSARVWSLKQKSLCNFNYEVFYYRKQRTYNLLGSLLGPESEKPFLNISS